MSQNSDQLSIDTPELVAIEMPLAGIGSRFVAVLIDNVIWIACMIVVSILIFRFLPAISAFSKITAQWAIAIYLFLVFLFNWGYFTLFEALWNGQTPGKKIARIRVIQNSGRGISLFESMARNFIRYVDQLPGFYAVAVISVFATRQHQRLGDLAAGTLVVRERREEAPLWGDTGARTFTAASFLPATPATQMTASPAFSAADIAKLSAADLEVMEGFFSRRLDLSTETRASLAQRIALAIATKSGIQVPDRMNVETYLETIAQQLRDQARLL
ncbi:MAG TPA: RDD family protein [Terracidiphilus sp.]|nr:RDD family protein [Terracidiphilus sp.]